VERAQLHVRRSAITHIVFGMNFDEADRRFAGKNVGEMLRLEADAGSGGQTRCKLHDGSREEGQAGSTPLARFPLAAGQLFIGMREPMPFGVFIASQVPLATYFQALPW